MKQQGKRARWALVALAAALVPVGALAQADPVIGERPVIEEHLDHATIDAGEISFDDLFKHGARVFDARFNKLDGQGRPATTGGGAPRVPDQPAFIRTSAPESNSCAGCHAQPRSGGAGDFVANVFVLAQTLDPVTESVSGNFSNERNTLGMMGSGPIEMLAREMTAELQSTRDAALAAAADSGSPVTVGLEAKGVDFGSLTAMPNGQIDPTEIDGVDWDLIVKPFHQKGAVVSLREFSNNAMNHHHGIQTVERFGDGVDHDQDGYVNELSNGDVTAVTIYQAALNTPGVVLPDHPARRQAAINGFVTFGEAQCTSCHVTALRLDSTMFTEPNPYNPAGNLTEGDVPTYSFDMASQGPAPRLRRQADGSALVYAFTDLKRYNLNDDELNHFANEQVPQGSLVGFADPADFTIDPQPRPTEEFLTRKLWDVGNSDPYGHRGDLTTLTEAIHFHGGDARESRDAFFALPEERQAEVIEFLKTLQVLPRGSRRIVNEASLRD